MNSWNDQVAPCYKGEEKKGDLCPDWKERLMEWCDSRAANWPKNYIEQQLGVH